MEEIEPMMVNVMDFSIKHWELPTNNIHLFKGDGGMEYAMSTLMLGNGTRRDLWNST
jgi:hypothetical protein